MCINRVQEIPIVPSGTPSILLSPAYRLAPESKAIDSLHDVRDFWTWLHSTPSPLVDILKPYGVAPSLEQILTVGESAGGYLSLQTTLLYQNVSKVGAAVAQYPATYPELWPNVTRPENPAADKIIDDYVAALKPGAIRTSTPYPELQDLTGAYLGTGRIVELYGNNAQEVEETTLRYAVSRGQKDLPPIWILQGTRDSIVSSFIPFFIFTCPRLIFLQWVQDSAAPGCRDCSLRHLWF